MLEVLETGLEATVQDRGRSGFGHLGVPRAGAVDLPSLELGNRILGNGEGSAGVEILLGGVTFRAHTSILVALTGATCAASVEGGPVAFGQPITLRSGQTLSLGQAPRALRTYLTVSGGIATPLYLGSRSTDTLSGVGPQVLCRGDLLPVGAAPRTAPARGLDFHIDPGCSPSRGVKPQVRLDFRWGPRDQLFGEPARQALVSQVWTVSSEASRVGVRLSGQPLPAASTGDMPTEGMHLGSIQVPPSGLPLVFLANSPPTGGYPVMGVVSRSALYRLSQLVPGTHVVFRPRAEHR